jgi:hypothetical protein
MRLIVVTLCLLLAGCAGSSFRTWIQDKPQGNLLVSMRKIERDSTGSIEHDAGYFFYVETEPARLGPALTAYHIVDRDRREYPLVGGRLDSKDVVKAIAALGLEPFDFQKEVQTVTTRLEKEAEQRGGGFFRVTDPSGTEYEIVIMTYKGKFYLRERDALSTIDAYAVYSPKIAKLKTVIDILAKYYGPLEFEYGLP